MYDNSRGVVKLCVTISRLNPFLTRFLVLEEFFLVKDYLMSSLELFL